MNFRLFIIVTALASIVTLSGCVYRQDIPQGNRIDTEAAAQLKSGMTKRQVTFLMGEPAIKDPYHPDIWHYIHFFKSGDDGSIDKRVMTLRFNEDRLASIKGSLIKPSKSNRDPASSMPDTGKPGSARKKQPR